MFKRSATILLAFLMLMTILPPLETTAQASSADDAFASILQQYPSGSYFTLNGKACVHGEEAVKCPVCGYGGNNSCANCSLISISRANHVTVPSGQGCAHTCLAFATYFLNQVFGNNISEKSQVGTGFGNKTSASTFSNAQLGDIVYFYNENKQYCHAAIFIEQTSNGIVLYDSNRTGTSKVFYGEVSYQNLPYTYCKIFRAKNSGNITYLPEQNQAVATIPSPTAATKITFSDLTTPGNLKEGNGGHIGGYIYSSNSPICSVTAEVYNESGQRTLTVSSNGFSVSRYGPIRNSKIDTNLKFGTLPAGTYYIRYTAKTKDGTTATASTGTFTITGKTAAHITHAKGTYLWCEEQHPHYNYYICSLCGEKFTDGSTNYVESCTTCNPVKDTTPSTESNETQKGGPWSDWSTTEVTPSNTRQVETREVKVSDGYTEYRYGRFVADGHDCWCRTYLQNLSYVSGTASLDYTSWSTTRFGTSGRNWTCGYCNGIHTGVHHTDSNGRPFWVEYKSPSGASYYWEEIRTVPAVYETQYRYRDLIQ